MGDRNGVKSHENVKMLRLFSQKKGQIAAHLLIGLLLFDILWYVILGSFALDGVDIGGQSNVYYADVNVSGSDAGLGTGDVYDSTGEAYTWIARFFINVFNLPWWLNVFVVGLNTVGLVVIIAAWLRGV